MEHFFHRKPTRGYIELVKESKKEIKEYDIEVPNYISKAACYVEDAKDGRLANGKGKMSEQTQLIQLFFFIQTHAWWSRFIYSAVVFMTMMMFFEPASTTAITVCEDGLFDFSMNTSICTNSGIITPWQTWTLFIEFLMIMIFVCDIIMKAAYMKWRVYCTKKWHKISGFFILLFIIDWIIFLFSYKIFGIGFRFSRPFRPLLLLTRNRELRRILETLLSMMNDLLKQILQIFLFLLIFSWLAVILYGDLYSFTNECVDHKYVDPDNENALNVSEQLKKDPLYCVKNICWDTNVYRYCICDDTNTSNTSTGCDDEYEQFSEHYLSEEMDLYNGTFDSVPLALVRLMVLISTENYPDILLPAYKANEWNMLFFVAFIFIGMFLLLSVLLAVIVEFWLTYLKQTNDNEKRKERLGLAKAFTWIDKARNYHIKRKSWNKLILLLKKDFNKLQSQFMFEILDWEQKGHLDVLDFLNITEVLKLQYKLTDLDNSSAIQNSRYGRLAGRLLKWSYTIKFFGVFKDRQITISNIGKAVVYLHTLLALTAAHDVEENIVKGLRAVNSVLMCVLMLELGLRIFAKGRTFCQSFTNQWEIFAITISFAAMIVYWIRSVVSGMLSETYDYDSKSVKIFAIILWDILIVLRPSITGQRLLFLYKVTTVLVDLIIFIVIIVFVFMGIGLELFAIQSNGADSNYFEHFACGVGFAKPTCGLLTLWQQITTSNWHEMMNGVHDSVGEGFFSGGLFAYLYFGAFYIMINIILLDLIIAMTIELYNAIKSQYFTSGDDQDYDGVFFEIYDNTDELFHHRRMSSAITKKSFSKSSLQLQVARSTGGSWRQSVINADMFNVSVEDLNKLQKNLESEKIGHGELKGTLYLNTKENEVNLRLMSDEKANEFKNMNNPECVLYFLFPIKNHEGTEVGELVMELKDHHSHDANIKLNFNSSLYPDKWQIESEVNGSDEPYAEYIGAFLPRKELLNASHDYHGFQTTHWSIKKAQRVQLRNDTIKVVIYLNPPLNEEGLNPEGIAEEELKLTADIKGYNKERKRWEDKLVEVAKTRDIFGNISDLLRYNAYRVSIKDELKKIKVNANDNEIGKSKGDLSKTIYILEKDNDSYTINKAAYNSWKRTMTIERDPVHRNRAEMLKTNKHVANFLKKRRSELNESEIVSTKDKHNKLQALVGEKSSSASTTPTSPTTPTKKTPTRTNTLVSAMLRSTQPKPTSESERALLSLYQKNSNPSKPPVVEESSDDSDTTATSDESDADSDDSENDTGTKSNDKSTSVADVAADAIRSSLKNLKKSAENLAGSRKNSQNLQIPNSSDSQLTPTSIRSSPGMLQLEPNDDPFSGLLSATSSPRTPKLLQKFKRALSRRGSENIVNEPENEMVPLDSGPASTAPTVIVTDHGDNDDNRSNFGPTPKVPLEKQKSAP